MAFAMIHAFIYLTRTDLVTNISKGGGEVLLVFAHPDDETMFFLPLILQMRASNIKFRLLCLSTGNYDGLGPVRVGELQAVARALGALSCDIIDDRNLEDGPHVWKSTSVTVVVEKYLKSKPRVSALFTFDSYGVSGHPNHISVYNGIIGRKWNFPVYILKSVPIWRKYVPVLDVIALLLSHDETLVAVNVWDPFKSLKMMKLYRSQNVWFRKLFSIFSKYGYVNEFSLIT